MKRCFDCKADKPSEAFSKCKSAKDGLQPRCKGCTKEYNKPRLKEMNERASKWYYDNKDRARANARKRKYGISEEEYDDLAIKQGGVCSICGGDNGEEPLCVDHDHETGKVRALLCSGCNKGLGHFKDSEFLLQRAAEYVRQHKTT